MSGDVTLVVREAIITALRANAGVASLVDPAKVFGMWSPEDTVYPFVRYGAPDTRPFRATGIDGSSIAVTIHVFADGPSEDQACLIAAAIVKALDSAALSIGADGETANIRWTGGQTLSDASEPDICHAFRTFDVDAVA